MNLFSISDLQQFSGVKAHTIRIWEQRYKALKPMRTEGNTRYYNGFQLRRLLNIVSLINDEHKVSELCTMSDENLNNLIEIQFAKNDTSDYAIEYLISQCIAASLEFNEDKFDKFFSNAVIRYGIRGTYVKIIYPTLVRLGIMWVKNDLPPAQEHFVTNLMRQKFYTAIDTLPPSTKPEKSWLLFLLEDEFHEIGLLFANYLLRKAGHKVFYLGSNVPFTSIESAVEALNPERLLLFMVRKNDSENDLNTISQLERSFPAQTIYLATANARLNELERSKKVIRLSSVEDLEYQIASIV